MPPDASSEWPFILSSVLNSTGFIGAKAMRMKARTLFSSLLLFAAVAVAQAQPAAPQTGANAGQQPAEAATSPTPGAASGVSRLRIGPGDEADFSVYGVSDLTQHVPVSNTG